MAFDIIGNIAILKKTKDSKKLARKLIRENRGITTVLEKSGRVSGRLRTIKTKYLLGEKTKIATYKESGCLFKFDVEKCYFSPRLAAERLEVAGFCKKKDKVLVLFAGVGPYSIVIARVSRCKVVSVEINKIASKYALESVKLNKLDNVRVIQSDVKRLKLKEKFNIIVMARPQLKESFLPYVFKFCKKGTRIYYYDFGKSIEKIIEKVKKDSGKKVRVLGFKKAGEIAPYKFRWRVDLLVN